MIVDKNTIKKWYRATLYPTQEQFWDWLDSYWHKLEEITIGSIKGLSQILVKKADLGPDGKVVASQLPDTGATKLAELEDVKITDPTTSGQVLTYDETAGKWINQNIIDGGSW